MKKCTLALVLMAILPVVSAGAYEYEYVDATSDSYVSTRPAKTSAYKKNITTRKSSGYSNTITNNFYYPQYQTAQESSYMGAPRRNVQRPVRSMRYDNNYNNNNKQQRSQVRESYTSQIRKYFLAHPFFQPLRGGIGSVTDIAYAKNSYNFDMLDGAVIGLNPDHDPLYGVLNPVLTGKQESSQFLVKEDVSFGLSDTLALILMAQYDSTKVSFKDWSDGSAANSMSDSGLNIFGIGIQDRFIDSNEWIGMVAGSFLHQKDVANIFLGELKVGYKVNRTTWYGLARIRYTDITEGDTYGALVKDGTGDYLMLTYNRDIAGLFEIEGGIGAFSVLNKDFTLNGELIYGHYDWHEQLSIKGAIGWQPGDNFALNLYASTSLYDSANDKTKTYMNYDLNPTAYPTDTGGTPLYTDSTALYTEGKYKIKDYNEWKIGVQAILYF